MGLKNLAAKIISLALISSGLYQTLLSFNAVFFIYPSLNPRASNALTVQEGLVEKALLIYLSMVASGIYGVALLFKPAEKVKIIHLLSGAAIFLASLFFVTQTPFTTDPMQEFLLNLLGIKR